MKRSYVCELKFDGQVSSSSSIEVLLQKLKNTHCVDNVDNMEHSISGANYVQ